MLTCVSAQVFVTEHWTLGLELEDWTAEPFGPFELSKARHAGPVVIRIMRPSGGAASAIIFFSSHSGDCQTERNDNHSRDSTSSRRMTWGCLYSYHFLPLNPVCHMKQKGSLTWSKAGRDLVATPNKCSRRLFLSKASFPICVGFFRHIFSTMLWILSRSTIRRWCHARAELAVWDGRSGLSSSSSERKTRTRRGKTMMAFSFLHLRLWTKSQAVTKPVALFYLFMYLFLTGIQCSIVLDWCNATVNFPVSPTIKLIHVLNPETEMNERIQ